MLRIYVNVRLIRIIISYSNDDDSTNDNITCVFIFMLTSDSRIHRAEKHSEGGGDDAVGNPLRAQIVQFELFEFMFNSMCSSVSSY